MRTTKLYREIAASVSKDTHYPPNYSASPENALILLPEHHVQIGSALNRHLRGCRLTGNRIRMILNVFEQTVGFRKVEDDMNGGRLHQLLSVRADHSNQLVRDLYALNIILLKGGDYGFWMSLNYHFTHWGKPEFRHLATNDPHCLLSDYYQNEPEDSGIDLSMACLNTSATAQAIPATTPLQNFPNTPPESDVIVPLEFAPSPVSFAPNVAQNATPNEVISVVSIPPNAGQAPLSVVNTNPSWGGLLADLTSFGLENPLNPPNLGVTKNKITKKTTTDNVKSSDALNATLSQASTSKSKATKAQTKKHIKKRTRKSRPLPETEQKLTSSPEAQAEAESLLFFSKQKEQDLIANIEEKLDAKMQHYTAQISQMNQSIAKIVQGFNQVQQSMQTAQPQPHTETPTETETRSNPQHHAADIDHLEPEVSNTALEYQASVPDEENPAPQPPSQAKDQPQEDQPRTDPAPEINNAHRTETESQPPKNTAINTAVHTAINTHQQATSYLSCLTYPKTASYIQQRGMADLLSPIVQNDAQMLLDILADRIENGTEPVSNNVAYLARLLERYHHDRLDKSRYVSSEEKAQRIQEKAVADHASEIQSEYQDAAIDYQHILRNFGYNQAHEENEALTPMEYFTQQDLASFWEPIEQRLYAAQAAMDTLNKA